MEHVLRRWDPGVWVPLMKVLSISLFVSAMSWFVHLGGREALPHLDHGAPGSARKAQTKIGIGTIAFVVATLFTSVVWFRLASVKTLLRYDLADLAVAISALTILLGYTIGVARMGYRRLDELKRDRLVHPEADLRDDRVIRSAIFGVALLSTVLALAVDGAILLDLRHTEPDWLKASLVVVSLVPACSGRRLERRVRRSVDRYCRLSASVEVSQTKHVKRGWITAIYCFARNRLYLVPMAFVVVVASLAMAMFWAELIGWRAPGILGIIVCLVAFSTAMGMLPMILPVELIDATSPVYYERTKTPIVLMQIIPPIEQSGEDRWGRRRDRGTTIAMEERNAS